MEGALSSLYPCVDATGATFPIAPCQPPPQGAPCCQSRCSVRLFQLGLCKFDEARPSLLMFPEIASVLRGRGEGRGRSEPWQAVGNGLGYLFSPRKGEFLMTIGLQSLSSYVSILCWKLIDMKEKLWLF